MSVRSLSSEAIQTRVFKWGENLADFVKEHVGNLNLEGKILAITSKIVSIAEGCVVPKAGIDKLSLVKKEADHFLGLGGYNTSLTIKEGLFIPSAGIDESNSEGDWYILYPKNPTRSAKELYETLKETYGLKNFGIILTDSHTHPLRRGVTGIGLSYFGFKPVQKKIGTPDLFGRELQMTYINVLDALSVAAVFAMGEANEACPLALLESPLVEFTDSHNASDIRIPWEDDLYKPFFEKRHK